MSGDINQQEKEEIAREILIYLNEHPEAQDTLEGIVQWWLLERKIRHQLGKVKEALADLVKNKLIVETRTGREPMLYRLNPDAVRSAGTERRREFKKPNQ